jgi:hypothetical protein
VECIFGAPVDSVSDLVANEHKRKSMMNQQNAIMPGILNPITNFRAQ